MEKNVALNAKELRKRMRRTGKELAQFRAMLKAERKKGGRPVELAKKYDVSPSYIYLL
jgi:hypothetical protein